MTFMDAFCSVGIEPKEVIRICMRNDVDTYLFTNQDDLEKAVIFALMEKYIGPDPYKDIETQKWFMNEHIKRRDNYLMLLISAKQLRDNVINFQRKKTVDRQGGVVVWVW